MKKQILKKSYKRSEAENRRLKYEVHCNITVFAECESARNAAKIARMMNAEEKEKHNA